MNPLDKTIEIRACTSASSASAPEKGGIFGSSLDAFAVIPLGAHMKLFGARQSLVAARSSRLTPALLPVAMDDATVALRVARHLNARDVEQLRHLHVRHACSASITRRPTGIFAVLVGVVALSLVVGGIVIMNIMLMVVSERTREIGLRKALGARRARHHVAGADRVGDAVDVRRPGRHRAGRRSSAQVISAVTPLPARLEPWSVALGIGITATVGLFFGLYPASRAARLDPIEALRRE